MDVNDNGVVDKYGVDTPYGFVTIHCGPVSPHLPILLCG